MSEIVSDLPQPLPWRAPAESGGGRGCRDPESPRPATEHNFVGDVRLGAKADV